MNIGFDLDGTLCDISGTELNLLQAMEDSIEEVGRRNPECYYYFERQPLLNPRLFMSERDKGYVITARPQKFSFITKRWVKHYYPDFKIHHLTKEIKLKESKSVVDLMYKVSKNKLEIMKELDIQLYIDDDPYTIFFLREMSKRICFVQFGGRLIDEELYNEFERN